MADFWRIAKHEEDSPHSVLGAQPIGGGRYRITAYLPRASRAWIEDRHGENQQQMPSADVDGVFSLEVDYDVIENGYLICFSDSSGYVEKRRDPYCFPPELSDFDIYLFRKGELYRSYETLGAHVKERGGSVGTRFVVWAPNAVAVSVVGNFNHWIRGAHPMTNVSGSGLWEVFIPGVGEGEIYKFSILSRADMKTRERNDPYSFRTELRPGTGSIVTNHEYQWNDGDWMDSRETTDPRKKPLSIYEVHLGSWKKPHESEKYFYSLREMGEELIRYARDLGFTHLELMPVMEHPFDGSWGYQVVNYYSPTSRYGSPEDYRHFIDRCHQEGLGVILDWVPAHFPDDEYGLSMFDGTHLFDHEDPRLGLHPDWGTRVFNYGRMEVRNFLISNAIFWADSFHADGIRIDAVSSMLYLDYSRKPGEWIPNRYGGRENIEAIDFLRELNRVIHDLYPGIMTIAEESTAWGGVTRPAELGGLGFDFKWNMGWMHDTLEYVSKDPVYRKYEHDKLTFTIWYAFSENFILPFSHDEVVHLKGSLYTKMPGDRWQKLAGIRLAFLYMFGSPGKKLLFMGDEFAQSEEWSEARPLSWDEAAEADRRQVTALLRDLNRIYRERQELHALDSDSRGFQWIDFRDSSQSVIIFLRTDGEEGKGLVLAYNFTPVPRHRYDLGVPWPGDYEELLNTDSTGYGGSGVSNTGRIHSLGRPFHGRPDSIEITLPPLGGLILRHVLEEDSNERRHNNNRS